MRGLWFVEGCAAEGSPLRMVGLLAGGSPCWMGSWWPGGKELQWLLSSGVGKVVGWELVLCGEGTEVALVLLLWLEEGTLVERSPWLGSPQVE